MRIYNSGMEIDFAKGSRIRNQDGGVRNLDSPIQGDVITNPPNLYHNTERQKKRRQSTNSLSLHGNVNSEDLPLSTSKKLLTKTACKFEETRDIKVDSGQVKIFNDAQRSSQKQPSRESFVTASRSATSLKDLRAKERVAARKVVARQSYEQILSNTCSESKSKKAAIYSKKARNPGEILSSQVEKSKSTVVALDTNLSPLDLDDLPLLPFKTKLLKSNNNLKKRPYPAHKRYKQFKKKSIMKKNQLAGENFDSNDLSPIIKAKTLVISEQDKGLLAKSNLQHQVSQNLEKLRASEDRNNKLGDQNTHQSEENYDDIPLAKILTKQQEAGPKTWVDSDFRFVSKESVNSVKLERIDDKSDSKRPPKLDSHPDQKIQKRQLGNKRGSYIPPGYIPPTTDRSDPLTTHQLAQTSKVQWNLENIRKSSIKKLNQPSVDNIQKSTHTHEKKPGDFLIDMYTTDGAIITKIDRDGEQEGFNPNAKSSFSDAESHFIPALSLAIIRGAFAVTGLAFIIWTLTTKRALFFNELISWQWMGLTMYFIVLIINQFGFLKSYRFATGAQYTVLYFNSALFDMLFLNSAAWSIVLYPLYFTYLIPKTTSMYWATSTYQDIVGYNLTGIMMFVECMYSQVSIVKTYAVFPPVNLMMYCFLVWATHYLLFWDWPLQILQDHFQINLNPLFLIVFILLTLLAGSVACMIVYAAVLLRELINFRSKSL